MRGSVFTQWVWPSFQMHSFVSVVFLVCGMCCMWVCVVGVYCGCGCGTLASQ